MIVVTQQIKKILFRACTVTGMALFSITPHDSIAQVSSDLRQIGPRFGLTPEQAADVFSFIDRNEATILRVARVNQINERAFRQIALELGLRNHNAAPNRLLEAIQKKAEEAAKLETQIANLRSLIGVMQNGSAETPAGLVLGRAEAAYLSGDLDGAEAALEELIDLRNGELLAASEAWEIAHRAAIQLASSRDDVEKLEALVRRAREARRLQRQRQATADRMADWLDQITLANAYFEKQFLGSDLASLQKAISIYRDDALPLINRDSHPIEWAFTQYRLGFTLNALEHYDGVTQRSLEATSALRLALEELTPENAPNLWIQTQVSLGSALDSSAPNGAELDHVMERIAHYRLVLDSQNSRMDRFWLQLAQFSLGGALEDLDRLEGESGTKRLQEAVEAYSLATTKHPDDPDYTVVIRASLRASYALTLRTLASREGTTQRLEEATRVYQDLLDDIGTNNWPQIWARVRIAQTTLMVDIAEKDRRPDMMVKAWRQIQELEAFLQVNPSEKYQEELAELLAKLRMLADETGWSLSEPDQSNRLN